MPDSKIQEGVATGILGKKLGMTQVFVGDERVPVTVVQAGPCTVLQVKTEIKWFPGTGSNRRPGDYKVPFL